MGKEGIYKCRECGNEFKSREGGGLNFMEFRCIDCDNIKAVRVDRRKRGAPSKQEIGACKVCGGELGQNLRPMCSECGSRDVEEKQVLARYD